MPWTPDAKRAAGAIALVLFWTGVFVWLRPGRSPAAPGGVLLGLYLLAPLYALLAPVREHDPALRAATGCLLAIVLAVLVLMGLLAIAVTTHSRGLTWTVFVASLLPIAAVTIAGIVYVIGLVMKRG